MVRNGCISLWSILNPDEMADPKRPKGKLSAEDEALWKDVTKSVRPAISDKLKADLGDGPDEAETQKPRPRKGRATRISMPPDILPRTPASVGAPEITHGRSAQMDGRTLQRLRRGKLQIDGKLDLHGHTQTVARNALEDFLHDSFMGGRRTVLVITGKGDQIGGRPGVLKEMVPRWLNETPFSQWVTGFSYAAPKDGGNGALYIRVKRRRV